MGFHLYIVSASLLLTSAAVEAAPSGRRPSPSTEASALSTAYMQHISCTARDKGLSLEDVAEMTWIESAQADAAFRRRFRTSILGAVGVGPGQDRWAAQGAVHASLARKEPVVRAEICVRAAARFLAAVSAGRARRIPDREPMEGTPAF